MKTYWDLSGPERAALSHEDVARYVDVELMRVGCLKAPSEPKYRLRKVGETFDEYLRLSGGDVVVAARFLSKAYTETDIREASEWLGRAIPIDRSDVIAAPVAEEMPA